MDSVRLYRQILAQSETPIEIIEIGYLQVVAAVLNSKPDDISEKTGMELFQEKVSKVWVMAGKWDRDGEKENNFFDSNIYINYSRFSNKSRIYPDSEW